MIYTDQTRRAMCLAYRAHDGQSDKSGVPYLYHPIHLAEQMADEATVTAALLHDVLEDTAMTAQDLREAGISEDVIEAVEQLTRPDGMPYLDYVRRIRGNPIACAVKCADLRHNCDETRIPDPPEWWKEKRELYLKALEILSEK